MEEELSEIKNAKEKEKLRHNAKIDILKKENEINKENIKIDNEKKNKEIEKQREKIIEYMIKTKKNLEDKKENNMKKPKTQLEKIEQIKKKSTKKEQTTDKYSKIKLFSLEEDKENIKKLLEEKGRLLMDVQKNKNEINCIEMNFGQIFFNDKLKQEIKQEEIKLKNDYDNFLKKKQSDFDNYINDRQMINFFEIGKYNPVINNYVVPQIAFEFYHS